MGRGSTVTQNGPNNIIERYIEGSRQNWEKSVKSPPDYINFGFPVRDTECRY